MGLAGSTVTITDFVTFSETSTSTVAATQTDDDFAIATTTPPVVTETVTIPPPALTSSRQSTAPTIPSYAVPCSAAPRFTSACSCIGVVGADSTTITQTTTASFVTTITTTVETATQTVADSTVVIPVPAVIETVYSFKLQARTSTNELKYIVLNGPGNLEFVPSAAAGSIFRLAAMGGPLYQDVNELIALPGEIDYLVADDPAATSLPYEALDCSLAAGNILQCTLAGESIVFGELETYWGYATSDEEITNQQNGIVLTMTAIPVSWKHPFFLNDE
ncbi:hypothetical protein ABW20_dc0107091 [Dactylellina cionopaga]|nr:hypothetical protein ABW20_dc0107091 [Dactylellina cionopaga]